MKHSTWKQFMKLQRRLNVMEAKIDAIVAVLSGDSFADQIKAALDKSTAVEDELRSAVPQKNT
jgi:hypothetical protein